MNGSRGWRFNLFGFPVQVDLFFLIVVAALGWQPNDPPKIIIWVAVVFVSVLAHELGHALMGRAFGMSPSIELYGMGGLTRWLNERETGPAQNILISLAGPCTGLAIGVVVFAASIFLPLPQTPYMSALIWDLLWVNIGWALLNLLPIVPLDGGHVMQAAFHIVLGRPSTKIPHIISIIFAGGALALALYGGMIWGAMLAGFFAYSNVIALMGTREI